ncbi:MAG: leucine-rich repeat domain-containing protein [Candidatus Treponema excrementipullorum]|uniref:Leucine-rich repeat domain-containing protein n=1 Tax=Candidatus Treponema excrementipullorum TaxID=2838768 RepID=A0A9E2L1T0_9SPIR|nr:leucine-rich repeat domain-containing protein [Candidatus Treponema excrementipullorum]
MILFFFLFFASKSVFSESSIQRTTILKLQNDTEFSVVIQRGFYGGSDVTTLSPHEKKEIEVQHILIDSDEIVFYYYFDINYNSLSINGLKSNQQNFTVKPFEKEHTEVIAYPDDIEFYNIAIIIENRSDKSISLAKNNSFIELYQYGKNIGISVPPSSSASFIKTSSELNGGISIYGSDLTFPVKEFENKYVYTFEFDGESVKLKDYRPILKIGEPTWEIPVTNSQIVKFIRFNEYTKNTYIVGEDTTNSEKSQCFIQVVDNQGNIVKYDTEEFANCVFTDIIFYKDSLIVAAQNKDLQTPPFLIEFDNTGKRTGLLSDFSDLSSIDALYAVNEEQFYISGTSSGKDKIIILPVKYGNNLLREKKLFEFSCDLNPKNYKSCYDKLNNSIWYAINYESVHSEIYKVDLSAVTNDKISLTEFFSKITGIVHDNMNSLYVSGQDDTGLTVVAKVTRKNDSEQFVSEKVYNFNRGTEITGIHISNDIELVVCGLENTSSLIRSTTTPFMQAISLKDSTSLWRQQYSKEYSSVNYFVPCTDYGYMVFLEGMSSNASCLMRVNSVGKVSDNHQTLVAQLTIKTSVSGDLYIDGVKKRYINQGESITYSLLPKRYTVVLRDLSGGLIDYNETVILKQNQVTKIELKDKRNRYVQQAVSDVGYRIINNGRGLEIFGNGEISKQLWVADNAISISDIESVVIRNGITAINDEIFSGYRNLSYVELPESLVEIGTRAFYNCINLSSVILPDFLNVIKSEAFYGCRTLESIVISVGVQEIGSGAFSRCENLKEITVNEENANYKSMDGVLYSNNISELVLYPMEKKEEKFSVPESVKQIHMEAFYGQKHLKEITIGQNVWNIGKNAFSFSKMLENIVVETGNKWFQSVDGILYNYSKSRLIAYPIKRKAEEYRIGSNVETIEENAFTGASSLQTLYIDNYEVPEINAQEWGNPKLVVVVTDSLLEDYKVLPSLKPVSDNIISLSEYKRQQESQKLQQAKELKKRKVKDLFTPYQGLLSMRLGFYYGFSNYGVFNEFPSSNNFTWKWSGFGVKIQADCFQWDVWELNLLNADYTYTKIENFANISVSHEINLGITTGPNFFNRRIALCSGVLASFLWEGVFDPIYYGIAIPVNLSIRLCKFLSLFGEYKYVIYPEQMLERHSFNIGVIFNTTF